MLIVTHRIFYKHIFSAKGVQKRNDKKTKWTNFKMYMKNMIERPSDYCLRERKPSKPSQTISKLEKKLKKSKTDDEFDPRPVTIWKDLEQFKNDWLDKASFKVKSDKKFKYINDDLKEIKWGIRCMEAIINRDLKKDNN